MRAVTKGEEDHVLMVRPTLSLNLSSLLEKRELLLRNGHPYKIRHSFVLGKFQKQRAVILYF